jgi:hypothetical protein
VTIFGNVTDASGSVVAGAAITATNAHTSLERVTTSDDNGNSAISQMPVGVYAVKAVFPGFKTFRLDGIQTQVDENRRVNIVMELGALSESVTVAGQTAQVDTRSETLRDVIDSQRRGDFSASATPLRDPRGGVFPNNVIPTNRLHPASQRFLEAFVPLPNRPGALLTFASQETLKDDQAIVKVDHHLSQANQLSGRLLYNFNDRAEATANLPGFFAAIEYSNWSLGAQSDLDQPAVFAEAHDQPSPRRHRHPLSNDRQPVSVRASADAAGALHVPVSHADGDYRVPQCHRAAMERECSAAAVR